MESKPQYGISPLMAIRDCLERQRLCREFMANQMRSEKIIKPDSKGEFQFEPIPVSEMDLKVLDAINWETEQIAKAFNIPASLLNTGGSKTLNK